jgi:hypothetical protein
MHCHPGRHDRQLQPACHASHANKGRLAAEWTLPQQGNAINMLAAEQTLTPNPRQYPNACLKKVELSENSVRLRLPRIKFTRDYRKSSGVSRAQSTTTFP